MLYTNKRKIYELYISQPNKKGTKPGLPLVFIDTIHFLNNSLGSLVKSLGENDFYNLSQKFNANILDLVKKKEFFPITTRIVLKNLTKIYLVKINFTVH